jgi:hypothetical protein
MHREVLAMLVAGVLGSLALTREPDEAWVRRRVALVRASDTTGWARIPWVASLTEARRISARENKPVFLFTLDGNLETGRC